jgi:hypothetical protein
VGLAHESATDKSYIDFFHLISLPKLVIAQMDGWYRGLGVYAQPSAFLLLFVNA